MPQYNRYVSGREHESDDLAPARGILKGLLASLLFLAVLFGGAQFAQAQTVTRAANLTWTAPAACADGSAIANCVVRGYVVQKQTGNAWDTIGLTTPDVLKYTDGNLPLGTHVYRVLANSDGDVSAPSNTASKTFAVPGAPGSLVVTITVTVQ